MTPIENTLAWCREERARLQQQLGQLQAGRLKTGEKRQQGMGWIDVDTTTESIERCERYIAELEAILNEHDGTN
jgi:hypothetical protein